MRKQVLSRHTLARDTREERLHRVGVYTCIPTVQLTLRSLILLWPASTLANRWPLLEYLSQITSCTKHLVYGYIMYQNVYFANYFS